MSDGRDDTQARPAGGVKPSPNLLQKWLHAPYWGPGEFIERRDKLIGNWALAPTWTLEEGACLANNLSPRLMSRHENFPRPHPAAESVNRLLEFARRAHYQHQISNIPTPAAFIAWSCSVGFQFDAKWLERIGEPRVDDDWTSALPPRKLPEATGDAPEGDSEPLSNRDEVSSESGGDGSAPAGFLRAEVEAAYRKRVKDWPPDQKPPSGEEDEAWLRNEFGVRRARARKIRKEFALESWQAHGRRKTRRN